MNKTTNKPGARDFSARTIKALAARGIAVVSIQPIPGPGPMPWANASRGYVVNDAGTAKVWTFRQVLDAAA